MGRNILSVLLIIMVGMYWSTVSEPGDTPNPPLKACRILISEMNFYAHPGTERFVELYMACSKPMRTYPAVIMSKFALLFVQGNGYLVGVCSFPDTKLFNPSGYFVIGDSTANYATDNDYIVDFHVRNCMFDKNYRLFPHGTDVPMAIALVYHKNKSPLSVFKLDKVSNGIYTKTILSEGHIAKLKDYLQDMYIYGTSTPATTCALFHKIYDGYLSQETVILRDWQVSFEKSDRSLSRCGESVLPFEINLIKYCIPSPGTVNNCDNCIPFSIENQLPKRSSAVILEDSSLDNHPCFVEHETVTIEEEGTIVEPEDFVDAFNIAEADALKDSEANEEREDQREYIPLQNSKGQYIWEDCTDFPVEAVSDIREQKYIDLSTVLSKDVCYWYEILKSSKASRCKLCDSLVNIEHLVHDRPGSSLLTRVTKPGGYIPESKDQKKSLKDAIKRHLSNPIHLIAVDYFRNKAKNLSAKDFNTEFEREGGPYYEYILQTKNMIYACYQAVRMSLNFYNFNLYTEILTFLGAKLGHVYHNQFGMRLMAMHISSQMHQELIDHLLKSKLAVSILLDSYTDVQKQNILAVLFQTFDGYNRVTEYYYKSIHLTEGESGKEMFAKFRQSIQTDGLELALLERIIGMTSDGASSLSSTFRKELKSFTKRPIMYNHCHAHVLQLVIQHAYESFPSILRLDKIINDLYRFVSRSSKNKNVLRRMQAEYDSNKKRQFEVKKIFKIRWISSSNRATKSIINNWLTLVKTLDEIWKDLRNEKEMRYTASVILDWLKDYTFIMHLCFVTDVSDVLSELSLTLQVRNTTIIGKKFHRENAIRKLQNLILENGKNTENLFRYAYLEGTSSSLFESKNTIKDFEINNIVLHGIELVQTYKSPETVYLYNYKPIYIQSIITEFESYFAPDPTDNFDAFDPQFFKNILQRPSLGDEEVKGINKLFKTGLTDGNFYDSWRTLATSIVKHTDFDLNKNYPPEKFWATYLMLTDGDIRWSDIMRDTITKILSIAASSSSVERVFSYYSHEKTHRRYMLLPSTVDALIRIKFNGVKRLSNLKAKKYAIEFLKLHSRADDSSRIGSGVRMEDIDGNLFADVEQEGFEIEDQTDDTY